MLNFDLRWPLPMVRIPPTALETALRAWNIGLPADIDEAAGVVYPYRVNPDMRVSIGEQPDGQEPDWYELTDRCRGGRLCS